MRTVMDQNIGKSDALNRGCLNNESLDSTSLHNISHSNRKCLALFSGGLDSMLAIKLISSQGISVHAVHIDIGFSDDELMLETMARRANMAGASFERIDVRERYLHEVLFNPKFGYGKAFNPCIDCHGFMFKVAISLLPKYGASFVISGEVVGQRPMSQRNDAMANVKKLANDMDDIILRPMCAKLLAPTKPEREGIVDRSKLLALNGRGRTAQLELAKSYGFSEWASPGGGCAYTDASFAAKLKDFVAHEMKSKEAKKPHSDDNGISSNIAKRGVLNADDSLINALDLQCLRYGRHLRLSDGAKVIIGRDEVENTKLSDLNNPRFDKVRVENLKGALVLISKGASNDDMLTAVRLALTYAKSEQGKSYCAKIEGKEFVASPFESKDEAKKYFVV